MSLSTEQLALLKSWDDAKNALAIAKESEMNLRQLVTTSFFPNPTLGTQRVELPAGWALKYVHKINYSFDSKDALHEALTAIEATDNEGPFIAERLVKWTADLAVSEYKTLDVKYRRIIDRVLTSKPAAPSLEIEEPREKK